MISQDYLIQHSEKYISTKDFSLTGEEFELVKNDKFDLLITQPIPKNLGKYYDFDEYISHTDSKKSMVDKVYQLVRNFTLKKKLRLINSLTKTNKTILDVGCGTGDFLSVCKTNGWTTVGVEPNQKAREISLTKNLVIKKDINDLIDVEEKFDIITLWHVLEHVPDLDNYITKLKSLLHKNGTLIIAVPNHKSYDANYYKNYWAAFDVPRHVWHFSKTSIEEIFSHYDFKLIKTLPMKFDSYYVSLLSEKYRTGKMNPINAFITGFKSNFSARKTNEYSSAIYLLKKNS